MIGGPLHMLGDQAGARAHFERALAGHAPANRRNLIRFQFDQRVAAHCFLARILWLQGFSDQAMGVARTSIDLAQAVDHPLSLFYALIQAACPVALFAGDLAVADRFVTILLEVSDRHAMAAWNVWGQCYRGMLLAKRGDVATGSRLLCIALGSLSETAFHMHYTFFTAERASALGRAGAAQGLAAIDEALARSERNEDRWCVAELLRIKGELLLLQEGSGAAATAEDHYQQALGWARRQGALSWELRAATSLARLLCDQNRSTEAIALLAPIYNRFTEGFETADLKAAKALIDGLYNTEGTRTARRRLA
jgi:predicted ATPase